MYDTTSAAAATGIVALFGILVFFAVMLTFGYVIPAIIVYWRVMTKAGEPGWKAIVPLYNWITLGKIAKQSTLGWSLAGVMLANALIQNNNSSLGSLLSLASFGLFIALIVQLSKQFNKEAGFWWLVVLLPIVAVFMTKDLQYKGSAAPLVPVGPVAAATPAAPAAPATEVKPEDKPQV